jgi:hypothetical protein
MEMKVIKSGETYKVVVDLPTGERKVLTDGRTKGDCIVYGSGVADGWNTAVQCLAPCLGKATVFHR